MLWIDFIYQNLFWVLLPALGLYARKVGGKPEQIAAGMYASAAVASLLVRHRITYVQIEIALFAIDLFLLAGLFWLVITADRFWPLLSAALQALSCIAHLGKLIEPQSDWLGYQLMEEASSYPTLLVLAVGVRRYQQRDKRAAFNISAQS